MRILSGAEYSKERRRSHPDETQPTREPVYLPGFISVGSGVASAPRDPRSEPRLYR